jgi:hypothetical protein
VNEYPITNVGAHSGIVYLYEDKVVLEHDRTIRKNSKVAYPIERIQAINVSSPGMVSSGYFELVVPSESRINHSLTTNVKGHDNVVAIAKKKQHRELTSLKDKIYELKREQSSNADDSPDADGDPLEVLKQRLASGDISEEEFKRKRELLDE